MARSIWSGYINFGLVSVPVGLYSATEEHELDFHQFQRGTSDRIRYKRVNERTGREVDYDKIVKGHDVGGGEYVIVEREELEDIAPGKSRSLEISTFVDLDEIDPIHFQKSYYLAPSDSENASSYALLRDALAKSNRAGIASFVMRSKEYLATIRADGKVLVLETMYFADEIRDPAKEVGDLPAKSSAGKQLKMAVDLIEAMSGEWRPQDYQDSYTERVKDLVESKRKGKEVVFTEEEPEATSTTDLVSALRASVEAARARRAGGGGGGTVKKSTPQKRTAKKSAAKKPAAKKTADKKPAKKTTAKKTATRKTATKKATATKSTAKKSSARKTARKAA
ncbi:Ku protein [Kribbella flavida DSM 17836]|uniref:Non-homologous end joining protein Ku n=1 Tax=Kribbella flavida (strain DSM 17836 / JCM 10339 / NBRC 14399) TaxID=479435 RepID=D2Q008_KRIFD|nr:Ku protein [Kribbella flavida]ADB30006.1 Ku protein [Kribbella flavida DSM 17836]